MLRPFSMEGCSVRADQPLGTKHDLRLAMNRFAIADDRIQNEGPGIADIAQARLRRGNGVTRDDRVRRTSTGRSGQQQRDGQGQSAHTILGGRRHSATLLTGDGM